jgi:hypothetical protein
MKLLERINQSIGFTKNELRVVLFLILAFLVGAGVKSTSLPQHQTIQIHLIIQRAMKLFKSYRKATIQLLWTLSRKPIRM